MLSTVKAHHPSLQSPLPDSEIIDLFQIGDNTLDIKELIQETHRQYRKVFSMELTGGYNGYYSPHLCKLNWASSQRPEANKIPISNYDFKLKGILQEVCDDMTAQGVLKVPQDHGIQVQSVCPSFLKRKRRAANKPKHLLTKHDCHLLVNFSPVNEHIKNIPSPMTTVSDIYSQLGKCKHIIVFDLYNAFYQNHIDPQSQQWL